MSKELTPLETLKNIEKEVEDYEGFDENTYYQMDRTRFQIIENALKRLEEHDKIFKKYDINDKWLEPVLYVIKNHFPMNIETQLKKLETLAIIKECFVLNGFDELIPNSKWFESEEKQKILKEELK